MSFIRKVLGKTKDEKDNNLSETNKNNPLEKVENSHSDLSNNRDLNLNNDKLTDYMQFFNSLSAKSQHLSTDNIPKSSSVSSIQVPVNNIPRSLDNTINTACSIQGSFDETYVQREINRSPLIRFREQERQLYFKIALLGDGAVGKTALRRAYLGEGFKSEYLMTIGADFALKEVTIDNNKIKFQIWDLAGQPRFSNVRESYYNGCFGALIVFDRTRPDTFTSILQWLNELWKGSNVGPIPFVLLGNKSDLLDNESLKMDIQADKLMQTFNSETVVRKGFETRYFCTSAKTGLNISTTFEYLAQQVLAWIKMPKIKKEIQKY